MPSVICIGSAAKDIFLPTSEGRVLETPEDLKNPKKIVFGLGTKYHIVDRYEALGGCAANVGAGLSKLGLTVYCVSCVGNDELGKWILSKLKESGIKTDLMQVKKGVHSDLSAIVVDKNSGERTIFFNRDANENLQIKTGQAKKGDCLFVSALNGNRWQSWQKHLGEILRICKKGMKLAFNPGGENIQKDARQIAAACRQAEILIMNKEEAINLLTNLGFKEKMSQFKKETFILKKLRKVAGKSVIALTDGKRGAWVDTSGQVFHASATDHESLDATGAGDAFTSAFIAAWLKGKREQEALSWGVVNSGHVVRFYGAHAGLCGESKLKKESRRVKIQPAE